MPWTRRLPRALVRVFFWAAGLLFFWWMLKPSPLVAVTAGLLNTVASALLLWDPGGIPRSKLLPRHASSRFRRGFDRSMGAVVLPMSLFVLWEQVIRWGYQLGAGLILFFGTLATLYCLWFLFQRMDSPVLDRALAGVGLVGSFALATLGGIVVYTDMVVPTQPLPPPVPSILAWLLGGSLLGFWTYRES